MSHEILVLDTQAGREMAWHGLTKVDAALCLATSPLAAFEYIRKQAFQLDDKGNVILGKDGKPAPLPWEFLTCSDMGGTPLNASPVWESYKLFENGLLLSLLAPLEKAGCTLESAGTIRGRTSRFFSFATNGVFTAAGREFKSRINVTDSVDGSKALEVDFSNVCIVCANTWRAHLNSRQDGDRILKLRHTKESESELPEVAAILQRLAETSAQFAKRFDRYAETMVNEAEARGVFASWLAGSVNLKTAEPTGVQLVKARTLGQTDDLVRLFLNGRGNKGKDAADLVSGVTEFYTRNSATSDDSAEGRQKQFVSSEFGAGSLAKTEFERLMGTVHTGKAKDVKARITALATQGNEILVKSREAIDAERKQVAAVKEQVRASILKS